MGPFAMSDLAGLDVGWRIRKEHKEPPMIADELCEMGRYGQKTGAGWYRYQDGRTPVPDPEVDAVIDKFRTQKRAIAAEEIGSRTIGALVKEGAKILEEGIAMRAVDIDIIYITGYGFPVYRGGPMWYGKATMQA